MTGDHIVEGTGTLISGALTVTFVGSAAFSSASSYVCTATDSSLSQGMQVTQNLGTSVTFHDTFGGNDVFDYICVGN